MNLTISPISNPNFQAKKLVPLKDYKGPILKLTKADKAKISTLQEKIMDADYELTKLDKLVKQNEHHAGRNSYYKNLALLATYKINELKKEIKAIKENRFQKQIKKQANSNIKNGQD